MILRDLEKKHIIPQVCIILLSITDKSLLVIQLSPLPVYQTTYVELNISTIYSTYIFFIFMFIKILYLR